MSASTALAILDSLLAEEDHHPELLQLFKTRLVKPRRALLRQALTAGGLPESADLDALTSMLIGSCYGRYVTITDLPDNWPDRGSPPYGHTPAASPRHDHNPSSR